MCGSGEFVCVCMFFFFCVVRLKRNAIVVLCFDLRKARPPYKRCEHEHSRRVGNHNRPEFVPLVDRFMALRAGSIVPRGSARSDVCRGHASLRGTSVLSPFVACYLCTGRPAVASCLITWNSPPPTSHTRCNVVRTSLVLSWLEKNCKLMGALRPRPVYC